MMSTGKVEEEEVSDPYEDVTTESESDTDTETYKCVRLGDFFIPAGVWRTACETLSNVEISEILFLALFRDKEILTSNMHGEGGMKKLDRQKLKAIIRAVEWIFWNRSQPSPKDALNYDWKEPFNFPLRTMDIFNIETKVFINIRNDWAKRLLQKAKAESKSEGLLKS